jgi:glycosyltransferase involved in cell wall biosynthesis
MQWYKLSDLVAEINAFHGCLRKKIDVVHYLDGEHSAQFLPWLSGLLRKWRPKIVATYHQPPEILESLIVKDVISTLDAITVVSPEQVTYFEKFVSPEKIHMIFHGIDTNFFKPGKFYGNKGNFRCITVGHYLRDYTVVRSVAHKLKDRSDIEFHVVSSRATGLEGLPNVIVHRNIDDRRLLELYQQSDILFLPLLQSTANNALLEGIACGLPVVSTMLPSVKAYLPGIEAVLLENKYPETFTEAILHLMQSPSDRQRMAQEARRRADDLDWRNIAPQFEAIYSMLVNQE